MVELVTAALGLFGEAGDLFAEFAYAIAVTAIVVFVTVRLAEGLKKDENEKGTDAS